MSSKTQPNHGGKRSGAGRKAKPADQHQLDGTFRTNRHSDDAKRKKLAAAGTEPELADLAYSEWSIVVLGPHPNADTRAMDPRHFPLLKDWAGVKRFFKRHRHAYETMLTEENKFDPLAKLYHEPGRRRQLWWMLATKGGRDWNFSTRGGHEAEQLYRLKKLTAAEIDAILAADAAKAAKETWPAIFRRPWSWWHCTAPARFDYGDDAPLEAEQLVALEESHGGILTAGELACLGDGYHLEAREPTSGWLSMYERRFLTAYKSGR